MADQLHVSVTQAIAVAESAEAEFMFAFESGAPAEVQRGLGMSQARLGGGVVLVMAKDPTGGYWNKSLGFGVSEPITDDLVAEVVGRYRSAQAPAGVLQIAPSVIPDDWEEIRARHGLMAGALWVKLLRPAAVPATPSVTDLRVGPLPAEEALRWATVFAKGFEMPEDPLLLTVFAAATTAPGFTAYGAWDGERLVAASQLYTTGTTGAFSGAATLPEFRGRGAQSAFMQLRIEAAQQAGCEWLSTETWQELEGAHNPSLQNMVRAGFVPVYDRRNWVWRSA